MNLPDLHQLRNDESTYITFTKSLLDLDKANSNGTPYYFTKMVALNLPHWENPNFFLDLSSVGIESENPNICIPKAIQYYMENIIRQNVTDESKNKIVQEVTELAFYKLLNKMGLSKEQILESITFINEIAISNFVSTETNNGWCELICQIPNKCKKLTPFMRNVENLKQLVVTNDGDDKAIYDNGDKQYLFTEINQVLDFQNCIFDDEIKSEFKFNTLLLFYRDADNVEKLHGINFIFPFENKVTYWDQNTFTQKTNEIRNIGYQFLFNLKTCNNEASLVHVYNQNEHAMWWNGFEKTMSSLNSFLELKIKEQDCKPNVIPPLID